MTIDIKGLFTEEDAVSPVIGVILMVAITVILAAVIGAFVLDIGGSQESAPQVQWDWSEDTNEFNDGDTSELTTATLQHGGGDNADTSGLSLQVDGTPAYGVEESGGASADSVDVLLDSGSLSSGDENRVVFSTDQDVNDGWDVNYDSSNDEISQLDSGTVGAGNIEELSSGDTVELLWESSDGSQSQTLADHEVQ